jgi:hypothetical protein
MTGSDLVSITTARRVAKQVSRVHRGVYGARTGLRTLVKSVARPLLLAGHPAGAVADALVHCVADQPAGVPADAQNVVTGHAQSQTLIELTRRCVSEVALER